MFTRCIQIQQACRQSPPKKLTSKTKRNLLFYWRVNLGSLDDLGQIVRFVLGAPEEVLSALVRVCELFYNDQLQYRLRTRLAKSLIVRRRRCDLGFLRRAAEKTIAKCVKIRTQKPTNMPAKTPAHAYSAYKERAKLPRLGMIKVPFSNLAISFINPAILHPDALTSREVSLKCAQNIFLVRRRERAGADRHAHPSTRALLSQR